jgi:hypothetical protein
MSRWRSRCDRLRSLTTHRSHTHVHHNRPSKASRLARSCSSNLWFYGDHWCTDQCAFAPIINQNQPSCILCLGLAVGTSNPLRQRKFLSLKKWKKLRSTVRIFAILTWWFCDDQNVCQALTVVLTPDHTTLFYTVNADAVQERTYGKVVRHQVSEEVAQCLRGNNYTELRTWSYHWHWWFETRETKCWISYRTFVLYSLDNQRHRRIFTKAEDGRIGRCTACWYHIDNRIHQVIWISKSFWLIRTAELGRQRKAHFAI